MKKAIEIRGMVLGEGIPKICVPITGKTEEDILREAELAYQAGTDLVEWRADYYQAVHEEGKAVCLAEKLRETLPDMPILFTYRTEGGEASISAEEYIELNRKIAGETDVDLIDIELSKGDEICRDFCEYAHQKGKLVIVSSHDFDGTPDVETLVERMRRMRSLGADVPKVATMPRNAEDVLTLLTASNRYANKYAQGPLITMSMGWLGEVSRISGEIFGSALTFGTTLRVSAPGQLAVEEVRYILDTLHKSC